MQRFKQPNVVPPGNEFFYVVEDTGAYFAHHQMPILLQKVRAHLVANKLPIPDDLEADVEDYICRHVPEGFCKGEPTGPRSVVVTPRSVREFTNVLFRSLGAVLRGQSPYVTMQEAERRAGICVNCPMNNRSVCSTCSGLRGWVRALVPGKKTELDNHLHVCEICTCLLSAKIHLRLDILKKNVTKAGEQQYPAHCWLNEDADNA